MKGPAKHETSSTKEPTTSRNIALMGTLKVHCRCFLQVATKLRRQRGVSSCCLDGQGGIIHARMRNDTLVACPTELISSRSRPSHANPDMPAGTPDPPCPVPSLQRRDSDDEGPPPLLTDSDSDSDDGDNDGFGGDETGEDPDYQYPSSSSSSSSSDYGTREATRRRTDPFGISPATAIGARDSSSDDNSVLGRFFSRPRQREATNRTGAPSAGRGATPGGASSTGGGESSGFGRLPGSTANHPVDMVTISRSMNSDEVWALLRQVSTNTVLCGLAGHLLPVVAPSFLAMVSYGVGGFVL